MDQMLAGKIDEATAKEIVAVKAPRLPHYYEATMHPTERGQVDTRTAQATTGTIANNSYTLPPNQITTVNGQQYDRLALYNLTPPLNTISADGPSPAVQQGIQQIALYCMSKPLSSYECRKLQEDYEIANVPLIAAAYDHMNHPQQNYSIGPDGNPKKNTFIYYDNKAEPLSPTYAAWITNQLDRGQAPDNGNDPRVRMLWQTYCNTHHCGAA